jgi:tetratricopeptide (TPR) repeat protein
MMKQLLEDLPPTEDSFGAATLARFNVAFFERRYNDALGALERSPLENLHGITSTPLPKSFLAAQVYRVLPDPVEARVAYERAAEIARRAIQESPEDSARHLLLGLIYAGMGLKEEAINSGRRGLALLPESKDALDGPILVVSMARIYALTGDGEKALDLLERSVRTPGVQTCMSCRWIRPGMGCATIRGSRSC